MFPGACENMKKNVKFLKNVFFYHKNYIHYPNNRL